MTTTDTFPGTIDILLSSDGGVTFPVVLADDIPDTGTFLWDTTLHAEGNQYRLQIIATDLLAFSSLPVESTVNIQIENIPPTVIDKKLSMFNQTPTGLTVIWNAATDNITGTPNLAYKLYYSSQDNINTPEDIIANGTQVSTGGPALVQEVVTGLIDPHNNFWNVLVTDEAGNSTAYAAKQPSGFYDINFGTGGRKEITFTDIGLLTATDIQPIQSAIDNNGRIIVLSTGARLIRLNSDGAGIGVNDARQISFSAQNKLLIAGNMRILNLDGIGVWRFNENGSPDTSYGPGTVTDTFGLIKGFAFTGATSGNTSGFYVDGKRRAYVAQGNTAGNRLVWRFNPDGILDDDFYDRSGLININDTFSDVCCINSVGIQDSIAAISVNANGNLYIVERALDLIGGDIQFRIVKMIR